MNWKKPGSTQQDQHFEIQILEFMDDLGKVRS